MSLRDGKINSRQWNPGMPLPSGGPPNIRMRREDLKACHRDGQGTLDNPMVIWTARLTDKQRHEVTVPEFEHEANLYRAIDTNADIAKTAAIRAGCTVVWIVCPVRRKVSTYMTSRAARYRTNGTRMESQQSTLSRVLISVSR